MTAQYQIHQICDYERITKYYCRIDYLGEEEYPDVRALIDLAYKEEEFNAGYVNYIIHKHLHGIAEYIYKKNGHNITNNPLLRQCINNNKIDREHYDKCLDECSEEGFCACFEEMVDEILKRNDIPLLYYYYFKEEEELTKLLVDGINEFNNRKFFIIQ